MSRNKADTARMDAIGKMQCLCCELQGLSEDEQPFPTERNHLVDYGYRKHSGGDQATLPECRWHHRAMCLDGWTGSQMLAKFGPSRKYQGGKGEFVRHFGTDRERLAIIDSRLATPA